MSCSEARFEGQLDLTRTASCSSTRPGRAPRWRGCTDVPHAGNGCGCLQVSRDEFERGDAAFPTRMMQTFLDDKGVKHSEPMIDPEGRTVHCQAALRARDELTERLCAMTAVGSALDELLRRFGTANVAEVTGRTKCLVYDAYGQQQLERRSGRSNLGETSVFMDGTKRILAFSDAGGTGRCYHADLGSKSAGYRRVHFLLEPSWKAAEAIRGLGRSNRTNRASAPIFRPATTDCCGERRFISTIARRLDSLGALTRGQRQTGGQNLFNSADNLESDYAKTALVQWYHLLYAGP